MEKINNQPNAKFNVNYLPRPIFIITLCIIFILSGCNGSPETTLNKKISNSPEFLNDQLKPPSPSWEITIQSAKGGGEKSTMIIAAYYLDGRFGSTAKKDSAWGYLESEAQGGSRDAMDYLAALYEKNGNTEKSRYWLKKYEETTKKAAENGDSSAMIDIARTEKNKSSACNWYLLAAKKEYAPGERLYADCVINNGKSGFDEAIKYLTLAAEKGDVDAAYRLVKLNHEKIKDKTKDDIYIELLLKSKPYFEDNPDGDYGYKAGKLYEAGRLYCVPKSEGQVIRCQVKNSLPEILRRLQKCDKCSIGNANRAIKLYEKGSELLDLEAAFSAMSAAEIYGYDLKDNYDSAEKQRELYERAAELGLDSSILIVAKAYLNGYGAFPKDPHKAYTWLKKASIAGDSDAQIILGKMYGSGVGVGQNFVLAYGWINLGIAGSTQDYSIDERLDGEKYRSLIESRMSSEQVKIAQNLASNWKRGKDLDNSESSNSTSDPALLKTSTGTGFVINKNAGYVVTNQHVIYGCKEVRITGTDLIAKKTVEDVTNDLALLKFDKPFEYEATILDGTVRQGDDIVVYGFPLSSLLSPSGNLTLGIVSALAGISNNSNQIQITAAIQPGSSGSPVINKNGEVIGVVSMKLSDTKMVQSTGSVAQNVNFAVSLATIKAFLDANKSEFRTAKGWFTFDKTASDLAVEARKWTLSLECWK